jgi:ATP phosphoribosyltransferase
MTETLSELLSRNNLKPEDLDFVIAHQANMRINQMVLQQLGLPIEKTHHTLDRYGNTTMATIPITFNEAVQLGKIKRGDLVAFVAFGAAHFGVVGKDILDETNFSEIYAPLNLNIGKCRLSVACKKGDFSADDYMPKKDIKK